MNLMSGGIPLGHWFRIKVLLHWTFVIYAIISANNSQSNLRIWAITTGMLFGTVLLHEFGHCFACRAVKGTADQIVLWPLGGLAFCAAPHRPWPQIITTAGGPLVNAILAPACWALLNYALPHLVGVVKPEVFIWANIVLALGFQINLILLVFNLIPCYPMDGGRLLQGILWLTTNYRLSLEITGIVGTVIGAGFVALGLGLTSITIPILDYRLGTPGITNFSLIAIGLLGAINSFAIYRQSQEISRWRKN